MAQSFQYAPGVALAAPAASSSAATGPGSAAAALNSASGGPSNAVASQQQQQRQQVVVRPTSAGSTMASSRTGDAEVKRRVCLYYASEASHFQYSYQHPMKPHRIRMTQNLIVNYGLYKHMSVYRPAPVQATQMTKFHSDDYINFLRVITPDNKSDYERQLQRFNVGEDCPVFDGLFEYCQLYTSGSIRGAARLNQNFSDIAINWAGGLHHAKKSEASGFCYINDCVLAILELLRVHARVLYIDIDIHHGDGVEEAFYTTNRVMTVSFHKFGEYFPGTGDVMDTGYGAGKNYAINCPLSDGMDDEAFVNIFKPVISKVMEVYDPGAIVLQCGADSLSGDLLGCFNLSLRGHGECVRFVRSFLKPMLVLGGGGYTLRNVPRCWTYETSILLGEHIPNALPYNDYFDYYGPDYLLHLPTSNMDNLNTPSYLHKIRSQLIDILRQIEPVPSVQIQTGQYAPGMPPPPALDNDTEHALSKNRDDGTVPPIGDQPGPAWKADAPPAQGASASTTAAATAAVAAVTGGSVASSGGTGEAPMEQEAGK